MNIKHTTAAKTAEEMQTEIFNFLMNRAKKTRSLAITKPGKTAKAAYEVFADLIEETANDVKAIEILK